MAQVDRLKGFWGRTIKARTWLFIVIWAIPIFVFLLVWYKNTDDSPLARLAIGVLAAFGLSTAVSVWRVVKKEYEMARFVGWIVVGYAGWTVLSVALHPDQGQLTMQEIFAIGAIIIFGLLPQILLPRHTKPK